MRQDRAISLISLAMKAGKVASGEYMTESAVKSGKAFLVIVAKDASQNTQKKFRDMCQYYQVPYYLYSDKDNLGHCIGKEFRATMAILDQGFSTSIEKQLSNQLDK